ncbi:hypothetical protein E4U21_006331 [Claviceps maximensis]|nr:hypothetical protein E4U21_006331 [Claviceps maximensis]
MLRLIVFAALAASLPFKPPFLDRRSGERIPDLKFRQDGTFQITVFSDFHLGESTRMTKSLPIFLSIDQDELIGKAVPKVARGPARDLKTLQVMREVLDYEKPDFVVLNGDLITGEAAPKRNNTRYIDQLVKPLVERNLTWGSTYGEHDHTFTLSGDSIFRRERRFVGSRTRMMVSDKHAGTSNYFIPVFGPDCVPSRHLKCHPELLLWFFDSRGGYYHHKNGGLSGNPIAQPNWVDVSVVKWFQKTNRQLSEAANRTMPALAFVHIPIKVTGVLQKYGIDLGKTPGINADTPVSHQGRRWCDEKTHDLGALNCVDGGFDEPFMTALAATPGLMGLFYGHDHGNTWCHRWQPQVPGTEASAKGLNLCYGQHTGYGGYGDWIRGGRQIMVNRRLDELTVQTHIRLEDGRIVGAVNLNSTFGEDSYPTTPDDETYLS